MFCPGKTVIKESRQISELAVVTEYPAAIERLENGGTIDEALLYTSAPNEAFIKMLNNAKQQLKQAKEAIEQLNEEPSEAKGLLDEIGKLLNTISGGLKANFNNKLEDSDTLLERIASNPDALAQLKELLGK